MTIPETMAPGNYVIFFSQPGPNGAPVQVPTRGLVTVLGSGGSEPALSAEVGEAGDVRASRVQTDDSSIGAGTLLLVGLGVAGATLMVAGGLTLAANRRSSAAKAQAKVRA